MVDAHDTRKSLTPNELDCARIIQEWFDTYARSPTMKEIADEMDMKSKSSAWRLVKSLHDKGWLTSAGNNRRYSLMLTARVPTPFQIIDARAVGDIAAEAIAAFRRLAAGLENAEAYLRQAEDLETRLIAAVSGDVEIEISDAGRAAVQEAS